MSLQFSIDELIQPLVSLSYLSVLTPQVIERRRMTVVLSGCIDNGSHASTLCSQGSFFDSELNSELIDRAGKSYTTRQCRKDAFQAGIRAGSSFLVPRGVSQAAACDENLYQVMANDRGVLPL